MAYQASMASARRPRSARGLQLAMTRPVVVTRLAAAAGTDRRAKRSPRRLALRSAGAELRLLGPPLLDALEEPAEDGRSVCGQLGTDALELLRAGVLLVSGQRRLPLILSTLYV